MIALSLSKMSMGLALMTSVLPQLAVAQAPTTTVDATSQSAAVTAPDCAAKCIESSEKSSTTCHEGDHACLCQHTSTVQDAVSSCLQQTNACSEHDLETAVGYYPQFCAALGLQSNNVAAETGDGGIITAAGGAPTPKSSIAGGGLVLTATDTAAVSTGTVNANGTTNGSGTGSSTRLTLPAILGIVLGAIVVVVALVVLLIYSHVRRQRMKRRTRFEFLNNEFGNYRFPDSNQDQSTLERPPRCTSVESSFVVQPTPPEKDATTDGFDFDFGTNISRTSTLVSITRPAPARIRGDINKELPEIHHDDEPRTQAQHVEDTKSETITATVHNQQGSSKIVSPRSSSKPLQQFIDESSARIRASLRLSRSATPTSIYSNYRGSRNTLQNKAAADVEEGFDENNQI